MKVLNIKNIKHLKEHIKSNTPSIYVSSQTSTVLPYDKLKQMNIKSKILVNLNNLEKKMKMEGNDVRVSGAVNWEDLNIFLRNNNRMIKTSPTEETASVLAGVATSCTGERSFAYGNLRGQIKEITYINYKGEEKILKKDNLLSYEDYNKFFKKYDLFKNAPFPRLEKEIDLMIGTEGQLGIVSEILLETAPLDSLSYVFLLLPRWEEDYSVHLDLFRKIDLYRKNILSCELVDSNSWSLLEKSDQINKNKDVIFLEIKTDYFEKIYEELLAQLDIDPNDIYEIGSAKYYQYRKSVPRAVAEYVSREKIKKKGTDIQVGKEDFIHLMDYYREESGQNQY